MAFCSGVDPSYEVHWHLERIAELLEKAVADLEKGISTSLIFEMPPRHGKSETVSIKFPTWVLGKHPDWPIILCSYSADLAEGFGQRGRDIMEGQNYQAFFDTRLRLDSKARAHWHTQKPGRLDPDTNEREYENARGFFNAVGVGGAITGKGFKVGIIDDPFKNREEAESETVRENIWAWYKSTFRTRQEGAAIKIVVMQRWHLDDLVGRLLKKQEEDEKNEEQDMDRWTVVRFPAIATENEPHRKKGDPLWPWKLNLSQLNATRVALGPYDWSALYQQNPIPSEKQEFKEAWFTYYEEDELEKLKKKRTDWITATLVDLAIGMQQKDDESVIRTVGKFRGLPEWYLLEGTSGHLDPGEVIKEIFRHVGLYNSVVGLESVQYQKALKYFIEEKQMEKQFYFNVYPLLRNQGTAKEVRIRGLIPLYASKLIKHRKKDDKKLEKQLLSFPQGDHDDEPDALANALEIFSSTIFEEEKKKPEKLAPKESSLQGDLDPRTAEEGAEDADIFEGEKVGTMGRRSAE